LYTPVTASLNFVNSFCGKSSAEPPPTQTTDGAASSSTSARTDIVNKIIFQWKAHTYKKFCKEHTSHAYLQVLINSCEVKVNQSCYRPGVAHRVPAS